MQVVTSGVPDIDNILGGGIVRGSTLLVIYDSFSLGWTLPFEILKRQMPKGVLGVIINYNLPIPRLLMRARSLGLDIDREGKEGNIVIIDVFGSKYGVDYSNEYVYRIEGFNPETYIPKLEQVYREIFRRAGRRDVVELMFSLDGMAFEIGEGPSIKLLKRLLSNDTINGRHLFSLYLLNRDRVSLEFLSWSVEFSDYVLEFSSVRNEHEISEHIYVTKSLVFGFEPSVYTYNTRLQTAVPPAHYKNRGTGL